MSVREAGGGWLLGREEVAVGLLGRQEVAGC